ncbi:hypothetical protein CcCBS67573_g09318 [Chytriomyces confervae]|uniref:Manganese lipoxygenase n=1 Tax=Chytriomyces confervae TaxID=246404 RepID=A0A507DZY2_9FUNG|nr:hypothetical protein CcCBS67573_g09318 [Chytriomyces confervae]
MSDAQPQPGQFHPAQPDYSRSPCPALNTLANHGILPRDGKLITAEMLVKAVKATFNIDPSTLIDTVFPVKSAACVRKADQVNADGVDCINLADLAMHSAHSLEHDVSLTRNDKFFGDNAAPVKELVEALISESTDGDVVSAADLTRHRLNRYNHSKQHNPEFSYDLRQTTVATFEATVALNVLGRDGKIPIDHVRSFFLHERIPDNWVKPAQEVSIFWSEVETAELMAKWAWALTFNTNAKPAEQLPDETRSFDLVEFKTDQVENHIIPANSSNVDARVPSIWHGVFYTDGNPLPDETCSIANGTWHEAENAYYIPVYGPGVWGFDDNLAGRALYHAAKMVQLNYKIQFDAQTGIASFHGIVGLGTDHHHTTTELPSWFGDFTAIPTENPNIFIRRTLLAGRETVYRLVRIVNGDGSRTPEYESIYLNRLNNDVVPDLPGSEGKSSKTKLRGTQLVARVSRGDSDLAEFLVQITTKQQFHGMKSAEMEIIVYHSETLGPDAKVVKSDPIPLAKTTSSSLENRTGALTKSVNEYEVPELGMRKLGHIHAISFNVQGGLFKEWYIESINLKKSEGAKGHTNWYFPSYSWVTAGETRIFFNGGITALGSSVPDQIKALREEDLTRMRKLYSPKLFIPGLPVAIAGNFDDLCQDEKYNAGHFLGLRKVEKLGLKDGFLSIRRTLKSLKDVEQLYVINSRPDIIDSWRDDAVFGRQIVAGINPMVVTAISNNPQVFPPANFKDVTIAGLSTVPVLAGKDVAQEIQHGRFTIVDYKPMLTPFIRKADTLAEMPNGGTVCAPVGIFYHDVETSKIYCVAIQLEEGGEVFHPTEMEPKVYSKPEEKTWLASKFQDLSTSFTSLVSFNKAHKEVAGSETNNHDLTWLLVKMWFSLADAHVHELSVHLFKSHLCIEPFAVATMRQLSQNHPIFKLLRPHTIGTMQINVEGHEIFLGLLADIFSIGDKIIDFFKHIYSSWDFSVDMNPIRDLEARGFGEGSQSSLMLPGQFPWAEDTRDLHKVVKTHVTRYVDMFYTTDDIVAADAELQAWIKDCHSYHLNNKGLASDLKSKSQLVEILTNVIWTASAQHSSINYPQYDYYSYPPNRSGKSQMSLPKARSDPIVTESTLAEFLPPISEMELAINTVQILATYEAEDVFLGERGSDYFGPDADAPVGLLNQFQAELAVYNERVKERNRTLPGRKENPYEWLLSTKVVNSTKV